MQATAAWFLVVACLAVSLLSTVRLGHASSAQQRAFDEAAWTRATWNDFKLELPIRPSQPSDEARLDPVRAFLDGCDYATIDGPNKRSLVPLNRRIPSITVHKESHQKAIRAEVITKDHQVRPASLGIKCGVCQSLVDDMFHTVQHVADHDKMVKEESLLELLRKSCDDKILHLVLDASTVVAMDPDEKPGRSSSGGGGGKQSPTADSKGGRSSVYQLQPRPASLSIQEKEIRAVTFACKAALSDLNRDIAEKMYSALKDLKATKQRLLAASPEGSEPELCEDNNSQCSIWALRGECSKNPTFMLFHCKVSCDVCKGPKTSRLQDAQTAAAKKLIEDTCGILPECKGTGSSFHERVLSHANKKEKNIPKQAERELKAEEYEEDEYYDDSEEAEAYGVLSPERYLERDLGDLKNKCVYLGQGWWTYQLCYKQSIRQLHLENQKIVSQHDLGLFNQLLTQEVEGKRNLLEPEDLMAGMVEQLPYVSHVFSNGSPCEKGSSVQRQAELRIACSMGRGMQMKIREPSKCNYILILYTPSLCQHPDFAPLHAGGRRPKPITS